MGQSARTDDQAGSDRRRAERISVFRDVSWRTPGDATYKPGVLIGISATGMAMLTERNDAPAPGTRIVPRRSRRRIWWHRPAIVVRTETLSGTLELIAAEYTAEQVQESQPAPLTSSVVAQDSRAAPPDSPPMRPRTTRTRCSRRPCGRNDPADVELSAR